MFKIEQYIDYLFKVWYNRFMVQSSYNRATERTRRKIREAFADLLAERGAIKNISVTDLAERADITRGTFYNYYNNIYEVGAELQAEIEKQIFANYLDFTTSDDVVSYIDKVFAFLKRQENVYRSLLASDAPSAFLNQLENEVIRRTLEMMHENHIKNKDVEFELQLLASGAFAVVRKYYRGEVNISLDEIRDYLSNRLRAMFELYVD